MTSRATPAACPSCGAPAAGRFCAACGAVVDGAVCAGCRAPLTAGAAFCHRCGLPAGAAAVPSAAPGSVVAFAAPPRSAPSALPWAFAAIVLLAFGAYVAAQRFNSAGSVATNPAASPTAPGSAFAAGLDAQGLGRAPDISNMSPTERVDRLYNRIMTYYEAGKTDSVQLFAPMAVSAYQMLPEMDALRRYNYGRVAEITGVLPLAAAQADTLLAGNPRHLLGLSLRARVAELEGNETLRAELARRLLEAVPTELEINRSEYQVHRNDVNIAIAEARRRAR